MIRALRSRATDARLQSGVSIFVIAVLAALSWLLILALVDAVRALLP
jgi:hypothetical protein